MEPSAPPSGDTPAPIKIVVPPPKHDENGWFSRVKWVSLLGSFLICVVLVVVLLVIVIDEVRHVVQPGYTTRRAELYDALCIKRVDRDGTPITIAAPAPYRTRLSQKLDRFLLCATFSKLTVVGLEVSVGEIMQIADATAADTQQALSIVAGVDQPGSATEAGPADKALTEKLSAVRAQLIETQNKLTAIAATASAGSAADQGPWGVIVSSDRTLAAAKETASFYAKRLSDFPAPQIYETQGRLRVVFLFDGEVSARAALRRLTEVRNTGAYIRNIARWCGGAPPEPSGGVIACY